MLSSLFLSINIILNRLAYFVFETKKINTFFYLNMLRRPGFNNERLKRIHRKELVFNAMELEAINIYCKRYRIKNRSKFLREAIISKVLKKFEMDHPRLF
jgi:hypothetical protein